VVTNGRYTLSDIITRVQRAFGDMAQVQVTQADVIRWVNDACREVAMQHENLLQATTTIASVAGQQSYDSPDDCLAVNSVFFRQSDDTNASYYALRFVAQAQLNQEINGWQGGSNGGDYGTGIPQYFARGINASAGSDPTFLIFPAPNASRADAIKITYSRYPADVQELADVIDLPAYYMTYVNEYCMMKAYEMDEDWAAVDRKAAIVQSTLDFNNNREQWFGHETYPVVTTLAQDL